MPLPAIAVIAAKLGIDVAKYLVKKKGKKVLKKGATNTLVKLINRKRGSKPYDPNKPQRRPTGGFGDNYDSFIDPIGFRISNLDFYIFDKSRNKIFRFDYSLNLISSLDLSSKFNRPNIHVDDFEIDNWGSYYLFSKNNNAIFKGDLSGIDPLVFIDLDQQIIEKACCDGIKISSNGDIALLYSCLKQLVIFNRLGRLKYILKFSIDNPIDFTDMKDSWALMNSQGELEIIDKSISKLFSIPLIDNEYLLDITNYDFNLSFLTSQRIIEFYLD